MAFNSYPTTLHGLENDEPDSITEEAVKDIRRKYFKPINPTTTVAATTTATTTNTATATEAAIAITTTIMLSMTNQTIERGFTKLLWDNCKGKIESM